MNTVNISEVLKHKLLQIAEGVAFMFIEDDAAPLPPVKAGIEVKLSFVGPERGAFWLAVSEEDSNCLAAGMLGRPVDEPAIANGAAPAEFLNILGNWVLDALWGDEVDYHVDVPLVTSTPLERSVAWSIAADQRAVVRTDAGCTLVCGVTWGE
jgi:hypothetical protein